MANEYSISRRQVEAGSGPAKWEWHYDVYMGNLLLATFCNAGSAKSCAELFVKALALDDAGKMPVTV